MTTPTTNTTAVPQATTQATTQANWLREVMRSFNAGEAHVFLVHGDTTGYPIPGRSQTQYLYETMATRQRVVAYYDRAQGITFRSETDRKAAMQLLELAGAATGAAPTPASGGSAAIIAALAARQAAQPGSPPAATRASDPFAAATRPADALPLLERLLRTKDNAVAVVINYVDTLLPDVPMGQLPPDDRTLLVSLLNWAGDDTLADRANPVFLVSNSGITGVHRNLRASTSGVKAIEIALPNREARLAYITWYLAESAKAGEAIALLDGLTEATMANTTAGLSLRNVESILLLGAREGGVTPAMVKRQKDDIIRAEYTDVAEMIDPLPGGFSAIGGMDKLVSYFDNEVIQAVREGRLRDVPKGILLVGPPGTGKTMIVQALAQEVGFNAVALKMSKILGGIVGESEAKLARFFSFVRALEPCLVFADEIDQTDVASRGNNSGNPVAKNLFGEMLAFMGDPSTRGRVIMVFASNQPDLLDPAMKRPGRMDAIIPVLLPDAPARVGIIEAQARMQGTTLEAGVSAALAAQAVDYSAADLMAVVAKARKLAARAGHAHVTLDDAQRAFGMIRSESPKFAEYYTRIAVAACNDAEFLPEAEAAWLNDRDALDDQIEALTPKMRRRGREL